MPFPFGFPWRELLPPCNRKTRGRKVKARTHRLSFVPRLNVLEDRLVPTLTVVDHGLLVFDSDAVGIQQDGSPSVPGVYWLADANLAARNNFGVSGINPDGSMTWETALNWVAAMNNFDHGAGYLGHNNWTLPLTPDKDANGDATFTDHTTGNSFGFNFYSSLFGHLFYTEFGGQEGDSISSLHNQSTREFQNFQPYLYWGGDLPGATRGLPVNFSFGNGFLGTNSDNDFMYAIPEFSADPSDTPAPPPSNNIIDTPPPDAQPTLQRNPGGKTVHDSTLNINWLANADLAATNSFGIHGTNPDGTPTKINPDGSMNYETALAWIGAMNAQDYLGHNNWRLPDALFSHAGYDNVFDKRTNAYSEMGELYYTELGGQAGSTILLTHDSDEKRFHHFQPYLYWSETDTDVNPGNPGVNGHITFSFGSGYQGGNYDKNELYVIPVFDGPADGAPEPPHKECILSVPSRAPANLAEATGMDFAIANSPIPAEWLTSDGYEMPARDIASSVGLNDSYVLIDPTVHDDLVSDTMTGGTRKDWLLASIGRLLPDAVGDGAGTDFVTPI